MVPPISPVGGHLDDGGCYWDYLGSIPGPLILLEAPICELGNGARCRGYVGILSGLSKSTEHPSSGLGFGGLWDSSLV